MLTTVIVWHLHQPFFVPDSEILEKIEVSYKPLLRLHSDLGIPLALNITGSLLQRIERLSPKFIDQLQAALSSGVIEMMASAFHEPILPWLPYRSARRHVLKDIEVKRSVFGQVPKGFWPTQLAWIHWLIPILREHGIEWTVIDSSSKLLSVALPAWHKEDICGITRLRPHIEPLLFEREIGLVHHVSMNSEHIYVLFRHHRLSSDLVDIEEGLLYQAGRLDDFISRVREFYRSGAQVLLLAGDGEKITAQTFTTYDKLLGALSENGVEFSLATSAVENGMQGSEEIYLPATTFEVDYKPWLATPDDFVYLKHLEDTRNHLLGLCHLARLMSKPEMQSQLEKAQDLIMKAEDSSFYFWRFLRRTREPFFEVLGQVRRCLEDVERMLDHAKDIR